MKTADSEEKGGGENEAAEEVKYVYFFQLDLPRNYHG